ncbi:hypothetical protein ALI22I_10725 [Saccharothrix sp. ALI-22-I]|uniref:hypothetical protein n=1 Tax=Saccharothrix sp. ALI-22-I TaxID=1933778 RepID=UPI00097C9F76|nr:hypothetical protein [Saccharothrix sp. ALI-22-I]ONI90903.1 hypothetical protein ALI22I_10725 [Saccharothrix sp. ALI-22-I]
MQVSAEAGYSDRVPLGHLGLQVVWFAAVAAVGLFAFHRRTRDRVVQGSTALGRSRAPPLIYRAQKVMLQPSILPVSYV